MGTYVYVSESEFTITRGDLARAARTLGLGDVDALQHALDEHGWSLRLDEGGNVVEIDYALDKLHREMDRLLRKLAPFVDEDCFIQLEGETFLRYDFDGARCLLRESDEEVDDWTEIRASVLFPGGADDDDDDDDVPRARASRGDADWDDDDDGDDDDDDGERAWGDGDDPDADSWGDDEEE